MSMARLGEEETPAQKGKKSSRGKSWRLHTALVSEKMVPGGLEHGERSGEGSEAGMWVKVSCPAPGMLGGERGLYPVGSEGSLKGLKEGWMCLGGVPGVGGGPGGPRGSAGPPTGCIGSEEALASEESLPTRRLTEHMVPGEAAVDFSKPTVDSVHTEPAHVRSLGRLHGISISIRLEGEKEENHLPREEL